jgi:hypothetical protein
VLEAAVDRFCRPVAGVGPVEVGEYVGGPLVEGPAEAAELDEGGGNTGGEAVDQALHLAAALSSVFAAVGGDHRLVDGPGDLHLGVGIDGEELVESGLLLVGEQLGAGVEGPSSPEQRVVELPSSEDPDPRTRMVTPGADPLSTMKSR